jgi:hypothetical protein
MPLKIYRLFDLVVGYVVYDEELDEICTTFDTLEDAKEEYPEAVFDPVNLFHMGNSRILTSYDMSVELTELLDLCKAKIAESNPQSLVDTLRKILLDIK